MDGADALGSRASERAGSTNPDGTPTVVADKARVALGRTGIKAAREGKSKSGFLQKRGPLKVWQKRWFVLEDGELSYYRSYSQYERFKRQEVKEHNLATKIIRSFPVCAACIGVRNRGANTYNESEVLNRDNAVKGADDVDDVRELDHDIDFTITIGTKQVLCRAASVEEKKRWLVALNGATTVRSFTSKNLNSLTASTDMNVQIKNVQLKDLDIGEILGSGTTGTVKLAVHIPTGMRVAVKIVSKRKFLLNKTLEDNIDHEIHLLEQLSKYDHEHIVHLWGTCVSQDSIYIVMELCEGGELMEQLEHMGNYTEADAAELVKKFAEVLKYLHGHGIVHRDIKPENLLLVDKDDLVTVKMADFGLANIMEGPGHEQKRSDYQIACGSPAYMAPEIYTDAEHALHPKVDMWSLGVVIYMLLCGGLPFTGTPQQIRAATEAQRYAFTDPIWASISDAAKDLIAHLIAVDRDKRYSAQQVLEHPWVTGENRGSIALDETIRKLALFNAKKKFKGMAHAMIATHRMKSMFGTKAKAGLGAVKTVGGPDLPAVKAGARTGLDVTTSAEKGPRTSMQSAAGVVEKLGVMADSGMDMTSQIAALAADAASQGVELADLSENKLVNGNAGQMDGRKWRPHQIVEAASRFQTVTDWLHWQGLDAYSNRFVEEGYDDLQGLRELQPSEIEEVLSDLHIAKGHIPIMRQALMDLRENGWDRKPRMLPAAQAAIRKASDDAPTEPLTLIFHGAEPQRDVLDRLFHYAMKRSHPGIDEKGIERMNEFLESGRFTYGHYINMWTDRLRDVNVIVDMPRRVIFQDDDSEEQKVRKIFDMTLMIKLNGIDAKIIEGMHRNIADGRFSKQHYLKMYGERLAGAGVVVLNGQEEADADTKMRMQEHKVKVKAEKARLKKVKEVRAEAVADAKAEYKRKEDEELAFIRKRRADLEEMANKWKLEHLAADMSNSDSDSDSDEDGVGVGVGLSQVKPRQMSKRKDDGSIAFANPLSFESEGVDLASVDPVEPTDEPRWSNPMFDSDDTNHTATKQKKKKKKKRKKKKKTDDPDAKEFGEHQGVGGHLVHDSVSEFDASAWLTRQNEGKNGLVEDSGFVVPENPAEKMQQWKSQHVMESDLGHIDRVDGSIFAPEMNDLEIDMHRGQDPVTHQKVQKIQPSAKSRTRGALLSGLRNGELEKAVEKMERDTAAEPSIRDSSFDGRQPSAKSRTRGALLSGLRNGELEKAVEKMERDTAAEPSSRDSSFDGRRSGMHEDGTFTNPIGAMRNELDA